ncbi:MAG TPA: hypothetical protein VMU22_05800 [Rhizomicrobium sp.]|nr:hypothetical protein [Rhizomicrobium sp.]
MDAFAASLARSPELFPHAWDVQSDAVTLVRLTKADYEAASFLDERVLGPRTLSRTLPFGQLAAAVSAAGLPERCHVIFHIGHVGSTLLSRLLSAEGQRLLGVREPVILRTLARLKDDPAGRHWNDAALDERLTVFLKLWSRTFTADQTALIKATSFVSDLAPQWLARPSAPKALLLFVSPESYMATILAGPAAREEAKTLVEERLKRLHRRIGRDVWQASSLSDGEALGLAWATEMSALVEAKRIAGDRALALDFDRFLEHPHEHLARAFRHFDCDVAPDKIGEILTGPHMQRYSKAPEHAYSPELRRELLSEARNEHRAEIEMGIAWVERAAKDVPLISASLDMAD